MIVGSVYLVVIVIMIGPLNVKRMESPSGFLFGVAATMLMLGGVRLLTRSTRNFRVSFPKRSNKHD